MSSPSACGICAGPLELRYAGAGGRADPSRLSPSCHEPAAYADLYACRDCGTVQQPSLPRGPALHDLYREMRDDDYLAEETGRRTTANRLLDLVAEQVAPARPRLLDVGCGHGLLVDEARRRGWDARGLELSADAVAHARDALGLSVEEVPLDALDEAGCYDAIVMADVLEHVDDVPGALDRCRALLAPGGALCVATPDPSSRTARLAGSRWWGYLPAHTYLVPRATLRALLTERGLVPAADVPMVRTFSARYWVAGLAERGGPLGTVAAAVGRALPASWSLSLSLYDERVIVARAPKLPAAAGETARRTAPAPEL